MSNQAHVNNMENECLSYNFRKVGKFVPSMMTIATLFLHKLQQTTICGSQFQICWTEVLLLGYGEETPLEH